VAARSNHQRLSFRWRMAAPKLQSTADTYTQDVKPSLVKVEQVRIDEAADYILHNAERF
jgi:hypothetical protein